MENNSDLAKDLGRLDTGNRSQIAAPTKEKTVAKHVSALPISLTKKKETPTSQHLSILQSEYINEHQKPDIDQKMSTQILTPKMDISVE